MDFVEKLIRNSEERKDHIILCDDAYSKGITYGQYEQISGKVYAYLKEKQVGKEDFVMLCLPRGVQPLIALFGVMKAGAAFVIVEDNYAPERIAFIKKDCNCKVVIDSAVWEQIQTYPYQPGYVKMDEHDAAFAVYTSGTTGNPKGVLHEYGNVNRMIESTVMTSCEQLATSEDRFALVAPLNFVASALITFYGLYHAMRIYVVAYSVVKNPLSIGMYIIKNRITGTFLTPSYIRKMKSKPPQLKFCVIGSEPANDIYLDGLKIHNFYLMSESGFAVTHFALDRRYEFTPVGKSEFGHNILLLDENGNPVADGEEGEVCFENKYARGYINLPEETERAFHGGVYHTGDLAKRLPDGNFVICGRLNDMVKINGNRVEPGEIENVAKKVLGVDWTAVRIIDNGRQVYICVYYLKNLKIDFEKTRSEMAKYLPYYMLPSYFIKIDEVPLRPNGKMDRKALPEPVIEDYLDDYAAPENDLQKSLCDAFAKVLGLKRVGIHDDFYQLGGDSLASIEVLSESGIKGLSTSDIFAGHTPEKIAALYQKKYPNGLSESDEERDERARKLAHPLSEYQLYMIDYQFYTPMSTMLNLFTMLRFDKAQFEPAKMAKALEKVIANHPSLLTMLSFNLDGEIEQKYCPDLLGTIEVEQVSESSLKRIKDTLVRPFKIMNSRLYRVRLFETEEAGYIFFDVHHTVFDGTSFKVIMADIAKAYYELPLERDYYYLSLAEHEEEIGSERYDECRKYFESIYDGDDYSYRPDTDHDVRENTLDHVVAGMQSSEAAMQQIENRYKITRNAFFSLVAMLSVAIYNKRDNVQISWTYNGRDDLKKFNTTGLLLRDLPLAIRLSKKQLVVDLYQDVQKQLNGGIEHSCYPYTTLNSGCVTDDMLCFLYQQDIRDGGDLSEMNIQTVDVRQNRAASENILDIQVLDGKDGLALSMDYAASLYDRSSMERYRDIFFATAQTLFELAEDENATIRTFLKKTARKLGGTGLFISWVD